VIGDATSSDAAFDVIFNAKQRLRHSSRVFYFVFYFYNRRLEWRAPRIFL
jgi:hypothetical protein